MHSDCCLALVSALYVVTVLFYALVVGVAMYVVCVAVGTLVVHI